jgi:hypothetical protein
MIGCTGGLIMLTFPISLITWLHGYIGHLSVLIDHGSFDKLLEEEFLGSSKARKVEKSNPKKEEKKR